MTKQIKNPQPDTTGGRDDNLYSLEVGYAFDAKLVTVEGNPKGTQALPVDSAGDIIWTRVDDPQTPLGLEEMPIFTGTYDEVARKAIEVNDAQGRGRGMTFFPHPIAKLAA